MTVDDFPKLQKYTISCSAVYIHIFERKKKKTIKDIYLILNIFF